MPQIRPFAGIRFAQSFGQDISRLIAPPYDVLDPASKAALQAKDAHNIVTVDLPHLPAKAVGPDETYTKAGKVFHEWQRDGILTRDTRPALYPYAQTYTHGERTFHRKGFICLVKLSPFGQGHVFPHEKTYPDAIHDRLKLTRATGCQLSPIFGLFSDPTSEVTELLYKNLGLPESTATLDDVKNDLWTVTDSETKNAVIDLIGTRPIYIADGHHRYTMALQYQKDATAAHGAPLPPNHPANFCMFVLVAMQDDGLLILPTHRIIGGLQSFDIAKFTAAVSGAANVSEVDISEGDLPAYIDETLPRQAANTFGLFDGRTRKTYQISIINPDVLKPLEPEHSTAWRSLDVAILQRYLLDEILKPHFANGADPTRAYTADSNQVAAMTDGKKFQIALLLKNTPLHALEELGKDNEVMPPKSTYFFPKLATGMVMAPVEELPSTK